MTSRSACEPLPKPTLSPFALARPGTFLRVGFITAAVWCVPALRVPLVHSLINHFRKKTTSVRAFRSTVARQHGARSCECPVDRPRSDDSQNNAGSLKTHFFTLSISRNTAHLAFVRHRLSLCHARGHVVLNVPSALGAMRCWPCRSSAPRSCRRGGSRGAPGARGRGAARAPRGAARSRGRGASGALGPRHPTASRRRKDRELLPR